MKRCESCGRRFFGEADYCPGCDRSYRAGFADGLDASRNLADRLSTLAEFLADAPTSVRALFNGCIAELREAKH